ncbi:MAG: prepilin-type N-terminal cleavage/methylation domain-containing protein [Firmicutes bacterium]|nr:prepilin-type N-terminal cleavage/methylation domain-containing protein [Bacillota bacterium]
MNKRAKGFTLLELVIALGLLTCILAGVYQLWHHTSRASHHLVHHQSAFENARGAMDVMIANMQIEENIIIQTDSNNVLTFMYWGRYTSHRNRELSFDFITSPASERFQMLLFGNNEFARGIKSIYMEYIEGRRIDITIHALCDGLDCNDPIILHGSVDVRHKNVTFNP